LSNEWLEELFCPKCGSSLWCQIIKHDKISYTVRWARRNVIRRVDGKRFFD